MTAEPSVDSARTESHGSPNLGVVAAVYTVLFLAGLYPVTVFGGMPYFPPPSASAETMVAFFQARPSAVLLCAFFHFGAAIPLGIFTASAVSRLRFLGVRAAGPSIALFGGFATAFNMASGACVLWAMAHPGIAADTTLLRALYFLAFALGGPGFSVPMGILLAGLSVSAGLARLLPKWIVWLGLALAVIGEASSLDLIVPGALFLIPLTRFPAFAWLVAAGFALPKQRISSLTGERRDRA